MATDIMSMLVNVLCPTQQSAQACNSFLQSQTVTSVGPMGPIFYFLLFPSVIIILFIYLASAMIISHVAEDKAGQGLRLLVAIAAFAFVIINGWYSLFLAISQVWFIVVVLLFGFWWFIRGRSKQGGMPSAVKSMGEEITGLASRKAKAAFTGDEEDLRKKIKDRIDSLKSTLNSIEHPTRGTDVGAERENYWTVKTETEKLIELYSKTYEKALGKKVFKNSEKFWDEMTELTNRMKKIKPSN